MFEAFRNTLNTHQRDTGSIFSIDINSTFLGAHRVASLFAIIVLLVQHCRRMLFIGKLSASDVVLFHYPSSFHLKISLSCCCYVQVSCTSICITCCIYWLGFFSVQLDFMNLKTVHVNNTLGYVWLNWFTWLIDICAFECLYRIIPHSCDKKNLVVQ